MENERIGYFIAECRKEKQITQQELADKLNITNKAVSKWETGKGLPDITILTELAEILGVSSDEILRGKKNEKESSFSDDRVEKKAGEKVMNHSNDVVINYMLQKSITKFKLMAMVSILLSFAGIIIQYFVWMDTKNLTGWLFGCWIEICGAGIFYYYKTIMENQMKDYKTVTEKEVEVKEVSRPYLRPLMTAWGIMLMTLMLYTIR
jgi:transcriptional regulator with XRE-family HTH domain